MKLIVSVVLLLSVVAFASYYSGANMGYEVGYETARNDTVIKSYKEGKVRCYFDK